jgi:hypothetical protein
MASINTRIYTRMIRPGGSKKRRDHHVSEVSRILSIKIFNTIEQAHPFEGRPVASSGSRWTGMLFEHCNLYGVKGVHPLGCLPLLGREGVVLVNFEKSRYQIGFYPAATG